MSVSVSRPTWTGSGTTWTDVGTNQTYALHFILTWLAAATISLTNRPLPNEYFYIFLFILHPLRCNQICYYWLIIYDRVTVRIDCIANKNTVDITLVCPEGVHSCKPEHPAPLQRRRNLELKPFTKPLTVWRYVVTVVTCRLILRYISCCATLK